MPYIATGSLPSLFDPSAIREAAEDMADAARDAWLVEAAALSRNEGVRAGWRPRPTLRRRDRVISGIENSHKLAPIENYGSGLWGPVKREYEIRPKEGGKFLTWVTRRPLRMPDGKVVPPGTRVYREEVRHPGARGTYGLEKSGATVARELAVIAAPILERWKREQTKRRA